ncbi:ribosome biogenesis GTPase YlqF [Anaerococcus degeneri]|uniref:Ribosome biogenesis GTPase A n=1 Tax=Anaerococcus degeneri TaxID=361500 RepID=A0ABS7YXD4_9FIRM|nr:ribosome biogenesis GTPase YlqF [Anaerococcus degeneri]MBP2016018.1 ribosome biogenesis GTPase A [Anaerococcus degeneri]MCA2095764.1 ribosome biogenesis GTPase YlqF [Anaerococcus degeneri]
MALNINWYPGHMKKTKEEIEKNLKLVDIVLEIIDSRIPESSRNPMLDDILADKPRMIIMNKSDLADPKENQKWINKFKNDGIVALPMNSKERINVGKIYDIARDILADKFKKHEEKDIDNPIIRMMIVGVPNSGKSTFINNVAQRKGARVGNRPGVTQTKQWIKTNSNLQLLDTPGVLWPKFDDRTGLHLSYTNAIKDEILNIEDLTLYFIRELAEEYPENLKERYGVDPEVEAIEIYEAIAKKRGAIIAGGDFDYTRTATIILNDFRTGKLGRITLEKL